MKFKFFIGIIAIIITGFIVSRVVLFAGKGVSIALKQAYQFAINEIDFKNINIRTAFENFQNIELDFKFPNFGNLANISVFSRTQSFENEKINIDFNNEITLDNFTIAQREIFNNPAKQVFEDFPENGPDAINIHQVSEDLTVPEIGRAVVANLETMKVELYEDGVSLQEFEILSKGRPGTAWETPPGNFDMRYMTEQHFSSIGEVWMPYSMQFFGNYFIHGWPHYADGTPVPQGYSGGCIRMSDEDAEIIYNFSNIGTPVIVFGTTEETILEKQTGYYVVQNLNEYPAITSQSYIVADLDSGDILFSKDSNSVYPMASITKLMTALVSLETINQYRYATVSQRAYDTYGWRGELSVGEKILTGDLMFPLLLQSSNDAAEVLAEFAGRSHFINNMNVRGKSLGLTNTRFEDPSGLSPENKSTANDLLKLSNYIYRYKNYIFNVTKMDGYENDEHDWPSTSRFVGETEFLGGKNGFTDEARHTLITLVELPVRIENQEEDGTYASAKSTVGNYGNLQQNDTRKFAIILLFAENTEQDTRRFMDYIKKSVKYIVTDEVALN